MGLEISGKSSVDASCADLPNVGVGGSGGFEKTDAEQVEARPAVHLPFDEFEAVDVPLGWAIAPTRRQSVGNRLTITKQSLGEALDLAGRCGDRVGDPFVKVDGDLASQGGGKLPDQFDSAMPRRMKTRELFDQLFLLAVPPVRALHDEPR